MESYQYIPTDQQASFSANNSERRNLKRKVVQYDISFDRTKATELQALRLNEPERYDEEKEKFEGFLTMQLLTALGERYNLGMSEFSYRISEGKLLGEHSDEPFVDVLERGRDYRLEHGSDLDHPREAAEVEGFKKMQAVMADEKTPEGTVMISISPPGQEGSIYKHNFYDMFQKADDGTVRAMRFSSALSSVETIERLFEIAPTTSYPKEVTDVALLTHPINLGNELRMDRIHTLLHREHDLLSGEDFARIKSLNEVLSTSYIASLLADPTNELQHDIHFNAFLNGSDEIAEAIKLGKEQIVFERYKKPLSDKQVDTLGRRPVRAVDTGCGFSGGMAVGGMYGGSALGAYDVGYFATRAENDPNLCKNCPGVKPHFHCGGDIAVSKEDSEGTTSKENDTCQYQVIVGAGTKFCPDCGKGKVC